jgi:RND family efflux transporter MFP subunit
MAPNSTMLDQLRIDRAAAPKNGAGAVVVGVVFTIAADIAVLIWLSLRPKATVVKTAIAREVSTGTAQTLLNASGYVTARREATVSSKVTGKVVEVLVEEGMKVDAGQILARLDSSNVEKSLALADAQLESSRRALGEIEANLKQAESDLRRKSAAGKAVSQADLDKAETDAAALRARLQRQNADVDVAQRELEMWKQQLDDNIIRAPFAGVVTTKNAQPGEMISPMSVGGFTRTGICTIVDMSSLEIEVDVGESYINRVASGQPVVATLDSYPEWQIPCKVIAIIPTADRQKATVKVRVGFVKLDPRILPDMSVKVAFQSAGPTTNAARVVTVPKSAVQQRDGRDIVWLVRDGVAERRAVTVGAERGDEISIVAGLDAGEKVIVEPQDKLVDGAKVTGSN